MYLLLLFFLLKDCTVKNTHVNGIRIIFRDIISAVRISEQTEKVLFIKDAYVTIDVKTQTI